MSKLQWKDEAVPTGTPGLLAELAGVSPAKAAKILETYPSLSVLSAIHPRELVAMGIPQRGAMRLAAAFELVKTYGEDAMPTGSPLSSPSLVAERLAFLQGMKQEEFWVVALDGKNRVLLTVMVTRGTVGNSLVHPREVFRPAIRVSATSIVVAHNHPSGQAAPPSQEDIDVTERLVAAGDLLGIAVLDHVIIGAHGFYSFQESRGMSSRFRVNPIVAGGASLDHHAPPRYGS